MDNNSWIECKKQIRERLKIFALHILELSESLSKSERARILNRQITRSGTSTYANYRAALRAGSKAEFFSKLSNSVTEDDETELGLDLLICSKIAETNPTNKLHSESEKIIRILAAMRKRLNNSKRKIYQSQSILVQSMHCFYKVVFTSIFLFSIKK